MKLLPILLLLLCARGAPDDEIGAGETTYPDNAIFEVTDGLRFYSEIVPQPWRETSDIMEGFDWSLPPSVTPAPNAFIKGFWTSDPRKFPGFPKTSRNVSPSRSLIMMRHRGN